jgi:hypothetical protein
VWGFPYRQQSGLNTMSDTLETVTIYRDGEPVLINKSDLKDTDKLKKDYTKKEYKQRK